MAEEPKIDPNLPITAPWACLQFKPKVTYSELEGSIRVTYEAIKPMLAGYDEKKFLDLLKEQCGVIARQEKSPPFEIPDLNWVFPDNLPRTPEGRALEIVLKIWRVQRALAELPMQAKDWEKGVDTPKVTDVCGISGYSFSHPRRVDMSLYDLAMNTVVQLKEKLTGIETDMSKHPAVRDWPAVGDVSQHRSMGDAFIANIQEKLGLIAQVNVSREPPRPKPASRSEQVNLNHPGAAQGPFSFTEALERGNRGDDPPKGGRSAP